MYIHRRIWTVPTSQPCNIWRRPSVDMEWHWMFTGNTTCCWRRLYWTISCLFSDRENYTFVILTDRDYSSHHSHKKSSFCYHVLKPAWLSFFCETQMWTFAGRFPCSFHNWNKTSNLKKTNTKLPLKHHKRPVHFTSSWTDWNVFICW